MTSNRKVVTYNEIVRYEAVLSTYVQKTYFVHKMIVQKSEGL